MEEERKFYLTPAGLKKIKKEYEALKNLRIKMMAEEEVPNALESEDLNPEFASFLEDENLLDIKLAELENILKHAKLVNRMPQKRKKDIVDIGATVELDGNGHRRKFTIVGTVEADPDLGKISNESPIGRALLGHKKGEKIVIEFPTKKTYKIKKITYGTA